MLLDATFIQGRSLPEPNCAFGFGATKLTGLCPLCASSYMPLAPPVLMTSTAESSQRICR
jgi:hypothetical protein